MLRLAPRACIAPCSLIEKLCFQYLIQSSYSTQSSADDVGPGPRARSVEQAQEDASAQPARSPDAPADPADLKHNTGTDPQEVLRSSSWQAQQAMASSYEREDDPMGSDVLMTGAPQAAGRLFEKVSSVAGVTAQAASGAVSAMSNTVKAATGAAGGIEGFQSTGRAPQDSDSSEAEVCGSTGSSPGCGDAATGRNAKHDRQANDPPDTAKAQVDSATESGPADDDTLAGKAAGSGYKQAAERLMEMEGLPQSHAGKV